jgi:antitoxin VapB
MYHQPSSLSPSNSTINIFPLRLQPPRMRTAKLFQHGRSQAVKLADEFRFEGSEVLIHRVGSAVVLLPKNHDWQALLGSLNKFPDDFMQEREQPVSNIARTRDAVGARWGVRHSQHPARMGGLFEQIHSFRSS